MFEAILPYFPGSPDSTSKDLPSTLINECCLLPSQVIIPPLEIVPAVNGILSHLNHATRSLTYVVVDAICVLETLPIRYLLRFFKDLKIK